MQNKNLFFEYVILTKRSYEFVSSILSGKQMRFTKAQIGDGEITEGIDLSDLEELISFKSDVEILSVRREGSQAIVDIKINSSNIVEAFKFREIGIFAEIDGEEILYAYLNSGDKYDYLTPIESGQAFNQSLQFVIAVGNSENVEVVFNNLDIADGSISINMLDESVKKYIDERIIELINEKVPLLPSQPSSNGKFELIQEDENNYIGLLKDEDLEEVNENNFILNL